MALRYAVASGNWSATSTWNGTSSIPGNGDTVVANGYTVTIDTNVTIGGANNPSVSAGSFVTGCWYKITTVGTTTWTSIGAAANTLGTVFQATGAGTGTGVATALATLTTAAAGSGAAGGGFQVTSSSTLNSIAADIRAGTTTCLTIGGTSNFTLSGSYYYGGSAASANGVTYQGTAGTLTVSSGATIVGGAGATSGAIALTSTGAISFSSGCSISGAASGSGYGVYLAAAGSASFTSCAINGSAFYTGAYLGGGSTSTLTGCTITGGGGGSAPGILLISTATVSSSTINGGTTGGGMGISVNSGGVLTLTTSTISASAGGPGITSSSTSTGISISGILIGNANGYSAVSCSRWCVGTSPTGSYISQSLNGSSTMWTWYDTSYVGFALPNAQDVRNGVTYGPSSTSGTCVVPSASSVAYGVSVDSPGNTYSNPTTGTAVLTSAAFATALAASGSQTALQSALTSQGYTTTRAGYLDKTNNLPASPAPAGDTSGLTAYGAAKTTDVTTAAASLSTVTTAQVQSSVAAALAAYGVSTLTSAAIISAVASELATYGASTLTSSQVQSAVASALSTYGASTLKSSDITNAVIPLV